jgi:small Trp-rich protein
MWLILTGVLLVTLKLAEFGPPAAWSWWWVLSPFAGAAVWWAWADATGLTKKREIDKMEARKAERRKKNLGNLGMDERGRRHSHDKSA